MLDLSQIGTTLTLSLKLIFLCERFILGRGAVVATNAEQEEVN
jgi:hypothetical protein